jgi:hypothetical protein
MTELDISSGLTLFDGLSRSFACSKSETETEEMFKKNQKVKRTLFERQNKKES